jgi:dipeptidyl aminopeptidase/acylaminoacyl peptidase
LLLIHGEKDNNPATTPEQSKRLYHAIKGNGGKARIVMLPHESHTYRAKKSVGHTLAEMVAWYDKHVKGEGESSEVGEN